MLNNAENLCSKTKKLLSSIFEPKKPRNQETKAIVHNKILLLPSSHQLPNYIKQFPLYDSLLGRIGSYLRQANNHLIMIDIGANIGDSIIATAPQNNDRYLAIEPSENFAYYLQYNLNGINYKLVQCFLTDDKDKHKNYVLQENNGTAKIIQSNQDNDTNNAHTLDEILIEYPTFLKANFLKIDTDGFDLKVLGGSNKILSSLPMVLFECDDFGQDNFINNILEQMDRFAQLGYHGYLIYDNFGTLMANFDFSIQNRFNFENLLRFKLISQNFYYFDILVYPKQHDNFAKNEYDFFYQIQHKSRQ